MPVAPNHRNFDLTVASSGIAAWTSCAISEAVRLEEEDLPRYDMRDARARAPALTLYVLDEPEAHLHPLAQEQAAAWVAKRVLAGANVLLATHSVPFLRLPVHEAEYLMIARSPEWKTTIRRMTDDVLGAVAGSAEALGLSSVALIQLTSAWLVVEGEHDRKILDAFYGRELRQAGIQVLPLRGAARAKASFVNLAALAPLGIPFFVLLDNTRSEAIQAGAVSPEHTTEEEKIAEQLWRLRETQGLALEVLSWPYPDIVCALPIEAVREVARQHGGEPGAAQMWGDLIQEHEQRCQRAKETGGKAPDFKRFVLETLGLHRWSADQLVEEALRAWADLPQKPSPLERVVSGLLARVDDRPLAGPVSGG